MRIQNEMVPDFFDDFQRDEAVQAQVKHEKGIPVLNRYLTYSLTVLKDLQEIKPNWWT